MRNAFLAAVVLVVGVALGGCPGEEPDRTPPVRTETPATAKEPAPVDPVREDPTPDVPAEPRDVEPVENGEVEVILSAPATAAEGQELGYSFVVRNPSRVDVEHVVITHVLPSALSYVSSTPEAVVSGPLLTWQFGRLEPYAAEHLSVKVRVTGSGALEHHVTARADGGLVHEVRAKTEIGGAPSGEAPSGATGLTLVQTCEPSVLVCDPVKYRARIQNSGSADARDVRVAGDLPEGLVTGAGARTLSLDVGTVPAGETREIEYEVRAQRTGTFTSTTTLTDSGGASATASCSVRITRPVLALRVDAPATSSTGDEFEVRLTAENSGDGPARSARLEIELPTSVAFLSASDGGAATGPRAVVWNIDVLPPGGSYTVVLRAASASAGTLRTTATARAYCADEVSASANTDVTATAPQLMLACVPSSTSVGVGEEIEYAIDVTNGARDAATNVGLVCRLPRGQAFRSAASPEGGGYRVAGDVITFDPVPAIPAAGRVTFRLTAAASEAGDESLSLELTADGHGEPLRRSVAVAVEPPRATDLDIALSAPQAATVADTFDYTLVVRGTGTQSVRDVNVKLELPAALQYVSSSPTAWSGSGNLDSRTWGWSLPSLGAGESRSLVLTVRATQAGTVETSADVSAEGQAPHRDTASTAVAEVTTLALQLTCPESALLCDPLTMQAVVTNNGSQDMNEVTVTVTLPSGLTSQRNQQTASGTFVRLRAGQSKTVSLTARAARTGSFTTTATVTAGRDRTQSTCTTSVTRPVLGVEAIGPQTSDRGAPMHFQITVRNNGDGPAKDCVIENPVPAGTTFESATAGGSHAGGTVTWNVGVIDAGASKTVTLTLRADDAGTVQNAVRARGYCCDEATATATVPVSAVAPTLRVTCVISKARLRVGATTECTITVVNDGSSDATGVAVVCALPRQEQAVSASSSPSVAHRLDTRKVTFDPIATLAPRQRATFRVVVKALSTGDSSVTGVVRADGLGSSLRRSTQTIRHVKRKN